MTILVVSPGVAWSIADVYAGLVHGLSALGVTVRQHDLLSSASIVESAAGVDAAIVVSGILVHPGEIAALRATGVPVYMLFTETPYDLDDELRLAARVDGGWTHERTAVAAFQAVNPQVAYLPHAYHPEIHRPDGPKGRAHDVVFVGSGFPERVTFFNAIDWTGIDLGLYGIWEGLGLTPALDACVYGGTVDNATAASLYRAAKVGLNLYRRTSWPAESLNPRAYELAACGTLMLSEVRAEQREVLGTGVGFTSPAEAERMVRAMVRERHIYTPAPASRGDSWSARASQVVAQVVGWARREIDAGAAAVFTGTRRPWMEATV